MKRSPFNRKPKAERKPKREPWIKPRPRIDNSRMDCCPEARARAAALQRMGCIITGRQDIEIHHIRDGYGMGVRAPWWETIPLWIQHHGAAYRYSTHGADRDKFHADHGTERELLARVNARLPPELCGPTASLV